MLSLTEEGHIVTSDESSQREKARVKIKLAIQDIDVFNAVYEKFVGNKLPAKAVIEDTVREAGIPEDLVNEAVDLFIVNARDVSILQPLAGAERIVPVDHAIEAFPVEGVEDATRGANSGSNTLITIHDANFAKTCFYITPIGEDDSEERQHSDLFLGSIVEPALEPFGLKVIRADQIENPGVITKQVIEYLLKAKLVVADLSFHNPNVFYELAIRHATRLPTVQIIRSFENIPFDVNQNRTVKIDSSSVYSMVPQIETYRSQISNHSRRAMDDAEASDNPIMLYWPNMKISL